MGSLTDESTMSVVPEEVMKGAWEKWPDWWPEAKCSNVQAQAQGWINKCLEGQLTGVVTFDISISACRCDNLKGWTKVWETQILEDTATAYVIVTSSWCQRCADCYAKRQKIKAVNARGPICQRSDVKWRQRPPAASHQTSSAPHSRGEQFKLFIRFTGLP
jgi:hypothetical protein